MPDEFQYATAWKQAAQRPRSLYASTKRMLRHAAISLRARTNRACDDRFLRCLFCHYVFDDQVDAFERILVALKRLGTFVPTDTCISMLSGDTPIDRCTFHLSLDDGFRNNVTNALPLLRKHGIPAIFFVPSAMIEANRSVAREYCKAISYPATIEVMTWEDVASIHAQGYDVGSHTRTHARFADISSDPRRLEDEIAGSKRELERRLDVECKYISWPFGRRADADQTSLAMAQTAGYRACFGAFRGTIRPAITDRYSIPRHHFEAEWPIAHVEYFARGNMEETAGVKTWLGPGP
ncbi:MAG: polysaccharide deacetylase family protein [Phycisphaerae bacterium]|nr:polysaccharide deacetylase family protein [Phycisphaerae bacterium]